ncbi:MAG: type III pantothenate kinase, partial [Clostridia bacterium]|nr:type III pantothenate kinase [Clostridia bacterium]
MLLTLDIGNTNIILGCFDEDELKVTARITTEKNKTEDQYAVAIRDVLDIYGVSMDRISGAILSSVVPMLTQRVALAVEKIA